MRYDEQCFPVPTSCCIYSNAMQKSCRGVRSNIWEWGPMATAWPRAYNRDLGAEPQWGPGAEPLIKGFFLAFGRPTEVAKFAVWIVSDKRSICDVCIKLNRIPYTPSVSGKSKAAGRGRPTCWWRWERGSKNSTILLINGAFWWHG